MVSIMMIEHGDYLVDPVDQIIFTNYIFIYVLEKLLLYYYGINYVDLELCAM